MKAAKPRRLPGCTFRVAEKQMHYSLRKPTIPEVRWNHRYGPRVGELGLPTHFQEGRAFPAGAGTWVRLGESPQGAEGHGLRKPGCSDTDSV